MLKDRRFEKELEQDDISISKVYDKKKKKSATVSECCIYSCRLIQIDLVILADLERQRLTRLQCLKYSKKCTILFSRYN